MEHSAVQQVTDYLAAMRPRVDEALCAYSDLADGCPERLREAIRYSLLAPGKRLRPLLTLMAAEACGGRTEEAMPGACAVEMIHAYSLVHDDLPAMDDDDLRRGRPTCHIQFDEATAILAGDALLTLAFETLAKHVRPGNLAASCCAVLAEAAGGVGMVGGQADDMEELGVDAGVNQLIAIHRRKTGAMIRASLVIGGLLARADSVSINALERYGEDLGLAFQITDDLLDVRGDEASMGKRLRKDADHDKATYPRLLGVKESEERARRLVDGALVALAPLGDRAELLASLARYVLTRSK